MHLAMKLHFFIFFLGINALKGFKPEVMELLRNLNHYEESDPELFNSLQSPSFLFVHRRVVPLISCSSSEIPAP